MQSGGQRGQRVCEGEGYLRRISKDVRSLVEENNTKNIISYALCANAYDARLCVYVYLFIPKVF